MPNCAIFDILTIWANFIYLGASIHIIPCSAGQYASFGSGSHIFLKKIYVFKEQSAAPDTVRNLLFIGTDHNRAEKYQCRVLLLWDRISGRIQHRLKVFFSILRHMTYQGWLKVFSELRRILRFISHPTPRMPTLRQSFKFSKNQKRAWPFLYFYQSEVVQTVFSEHRGTIRFFWYPTSLV